MPASLATHETATVTEILSQIAGEAALSTGQQREAPVYAQDDAQLAEPSATGFAQLVQNYPQSATCPATAGASRLCQQQLLEILTRLFGPLDPATLAAVQAKLEWRRLMAGERLIEQGEASDALYLVVHGRLRVTIRPAPHPVHPPEAGDTGNGQPGGEQFVREIGMGETVGEIGLLTGTPRTASVTAIRGSTVVRLGRTTYEELLAQHPQMMVHVARLMAGRQVGVNTTAPQAVVTRTFALVSGDDSTPLSQVAMRLADTLAEWGETLHLSSARFDERFGKSGVAQTSLADPSHLAIAGWLSEQETRYRFIVYEADPTWSAWTQRCTQQADSILVVRQATGDPTLDKIERALRARRALTRQELVLLQPAGCVRPRGAARWLRGRNVATHHHLRLANIQDWRRLARRITGQAIGLVFSGGGAKANAHLGALRALQEQAIPIDFIGGTSSGAIAAAFYALELDCERAEQLARQGSAKKRIFDYTLPLTSLLASAKVTSLLQSLLEESCIEDLWVPYFCVSSNLSRAAEQVHEHGPLWLAVRASSAIPGIFSPVIEQGDVLVDGGLINNFPVDTLHQRYQPGLVIGVDLSPSGACFQGYDFGPSISGWHLLWQRLNPFAKRQHAPSLMSLLTRTIDVQSIMNMRTKEKLVDLLIKPDADQIGFDDYDSFDEVNEIGYQAACHALARWDHQKLLACCPTRS